MATNQLPAEMALANRLLTAAEFHRLADVPPEVEWFANLTNPNTKWAYENAIRDFMRFTGIARPEEFRIVTRSHIYRLRGLPRFRLEHASSAPGRMSAARREFARGLSLAKETVQNLGGLPAATPRA
jgi:hypothetical protein